MNETDRNTDAVPLGVTAQDVKNAPEFAKGGPGVGQIVSTTEPELGDAHQSFVEFHQGYVGGYISLADSKATWIFAIASGALVFALGHEPIRALIVRPAWTALFVWTVGTAVLFICSALFSMRVIWPRMTTSGEGVVFFATVAKKPSAESYVREVAGMTSAALTEARLRHTYDISRVCAKKYGNLRWAIRSGVLGLFALAALILYV